MKLRILLMTLMATTLVLTGCLDKTAQQATEDPDEGLDTRIYGTWNRTGTFTDGAAVATDPATTMFLEDGTYTSFGNCSINGAYIVIDDLLSSTINTHDCKGFTGPYEFNSTFKISEDGDSLTIDTSMSGHLVTETFDRATY